ncbi:phosphoglucosamine mutase [Prochlorothrix hollandica]|uniref:Phosphoglucosamine mutase n=1 Tax=Prochlorothrix hollandica PCC 9006 = CALU 1027 TaxID=317619 RepID=A0A0M2Q1X2_PROHO|nr:phosphoglucosamine mutase [Prochlorothrix hollandica]KKJ00959.1 phosphoglucosamine mutase [Prochlorothrix hollandica PCC 9006 = CALU 1027]
MISSLFRPGLRSEADPQTAANSLSHAPLQVVESFPWGTLPLPQGPLFGTDGIRGEVGDLLTAPLALHLGFWAGNVLRHQAGLGSGGDRATVILGQDSRTSSPMLALALSAGLTAAGVDVYPMGLCPTPAVAYLTHHTEAIGGLMISASHNPPADNGIKIFNGQGTKLNGDLQRSIETGLRSGIRSALEASSWGQQITHGQPLQRYVEMLHQSLGSTSLAGLRVVLDLAWGSATALAGQVFTDLGATVTILHGEPDGSRINVNCGSTHLRHLQQAVVEHQADVGFAFDGDADRVLAVDHQGRAIDGDYILYLWGQHLKRQNALPHNTIVTTVMANLGFERAWEAQGGTLLRTAVGDQYVQAEMARTGAMLGGEQSGHILCSHYGLTGDGLLTALHLCQLVQESGSSLAELVNASFRPYPQLLRNVRVEDRQQRLQWQSCEPLQGAIARAEADLGDRGRILVRASGTEPLIRVMVEAAEASLVEHWTHELVQVVEQHLVG